MKEDLHGLEKVIEELNKVIDNAIYATPHSEYAGTERNHIIYTLTKYMNNLSRKYQFQNQYQVYYNAQLYYGTGQLLDTNIQKLNNTKQNIEEYSLEDT